MGIETKTWDAVEWNGNTVEWNSDAIQRSLPDLPALVSQSPNVAECQP